jgi:hypothetical protein
VHTAPCNIPEDSHLHTRRRESLKSHKMSVVVSDWDWSYPGEDVGRNLLANTTFTQSYVHWIPRRFPLQELKQPDLEANQSPAGSVDSSASIVRRCFGTEQHRDLPEVLTGHRTPLPFPVWPAGQSEGWFSWYIAERWTLFNSVLKTFLLLVCNMISVVKKPQIV